MRSLRPLSKRNMTAAKEEHHSHVENKSPLDGGLPKLQEAAVTIACTVSLSNGPKMPSLVSSSALLGNIDSRLLCRYGTRLPGERNLLSYILYH